MILLLIRFFVYLVRDTTYFSSRFELFISSTPLISWNPFSVLNIPYTFWLKVQKQVDKKLYFIRWTLSLSQRLKHKASRLSTVVIPSDRNCPSMNYCPKILIVLDLHRVVTFGSNRKLLMERVIVSKSIFASFYVGFFLTHDL